MAPDPDHSCAATQQVAVLQQRLGELERRLAELSGKTKQHRRERNGRAAKKELGPAPKKSRDRKQDLGEVETDIVRHKLTHEQRARCHCNNTFIVEHTHGESKVLDWVPGRFRATRHVHETVKFACGHTISSEAPVKANEKSDFGPGLAAEIVVAKCAESTPIYRQCQRFGRMGVHLSRSSLTDLFHQTAEALRPIYDQMCSLMALQNLVQADETSFRVQAKDKCRTGFVWTFVTSLVVTYFFRPSRSGETPKQVLGKPTKPGQTLLVDGHTGYNLVTGPDGWLRAGCQAHGRRRFFDTEGEEAETALEFFRSMYRVEHHARALGVTGTAEHLGLRRQYTLGYFKLFHRWLIRERPKHAPTTQLGNAIRYALKNRAAWMRIFRDASIPLDNNASESALRVVALLRKNALFVGHDAAGQNHAVVLSIIATCKLHGVDPAEYIRDVLLRVQDRADHNVQQLLPHHWKSAADARAAG